MAAIDLRVIVSISEWTEYVDRRLYSSIWNVSNLDKIILLDCYVSPPT